MIFIIAMTLQIPRFNVNSNIKLIVFVAWAAYGVLPTLHWSVAMGGMENPMVGMLLPRVLGMYIISGAAFFIYISRLPERYFPGNRAVLRTTNWLPIQVINSRAPLIIFRFEQVGSIMLVPRISGGMRWLCSPCTIGTTLACFMSNTEWTMAVPTRNYDN